MGFDVKEANAAEYIVRVIEIHTVEYVVEADSPEEAEKLEDIQDDGHTVDAFIEDVVSVRENE